MIFFINIFIDSLNKHNKNYFSGINIQIRNTFMRLNIKCQVNSLKNNLLLYI